MSKKGNETNVEKTCRHVRGEEKVSQLGEAKRKKCKELASLVEFAINIMWVYMLKTV